jgi:alpha-tubulin suppressor-like RCC1 family protein
MVAGRNDFGQLGFGNDIKREEVKMWRECTTLMPFIQISAGYYHTLGLSADGSVWGWGRNHFGELGFGDNEPRLKPSKVPFQDPVTLIHCGTWSSALITSNFFVVAILTFKNRNCYSFVAILTIPKNSLLFLNSQTYFKFLVDVNIFCV